MGESEGGPPMTGDGSAQRMTITVWRKGLCQLTGRISEMAARSTRPMLTHCSAMGTSA